MQQDPNPVDWAAWLRSRPGDVRHPDRVIVRLGTGWHCQLCSSTVTGSKAEHHVTHMLDLDAYLTGQEQQGRESDSKRRADDRRHQRQIELDRAEALGDDPFVYAVKGVEPVTHRRIRRRRLRHPRQETEARIAEMLDAGMMRAAIADKLKLSEDYVRRVLKRIGGER